MNESSAQETTPAQPGGRLLHRGILTAILFIAPPVVLVIALSIALSKLPTATDPNKPPPPDDALLATIRSKHSDTTQKLAELVTAYHRLDTDFQAVLGFTLEDSDSKDKYSNRLLDVLTGPDPPIRAWTTLRNAAVTAREFDEKREVLRTVETKVRELRVTLTDLYDTEDVAKWADQKLAALVGQTDNLRELQARINPLTIKETP